MLRCLILKGIFGLKKQRIRIINDWLETLIELKQY